MRVKLPIIVAIAGALCACGCSDEPSSLPGSTDGTGEGVEFADATVDDTGDRGEVTTENIRDFNICAYKSTEYYDIVMNNVEVVRTGTNRWYYTPQVMWPDYALTFIAVSPASIEIHVNPWWHNVFRYEPDDAKTDVVVCVKPDAVQTGNRLKLNFRHALSRVDISAICDIPGLRVKVKEMRLYHVCHGSEFMFPSTSTSDRNVTGQLDDCWPEYSNNWMEVPYYTSEEGSEMVLGATPQSLDTEDNLFYIPFRFTQLTWDGSYIRGSSMRFVCHFEDAETGEQVWPADNTPYPLLPGGRPGYWGYVYVPLQDGAGSMRWLPGINYHYTVNLREGGKLPPMPSDTSTGRSSDSGGNIVTVSEQPY